MNLLESLEEHLGVDTEISFTDEEKEILNVEYEGNDGHCIFIIDEDEEKYQAINSILEKYGIAWYDASPLFDIRVADGHFRGPRTDYYIDLIDNALVSINQGEAYYNEPGEWATSLIKEIGIQHPNRVLRVLREYKDHHDIPIVEGTDYLIDVDEMDREEFTIYEVLKELDFSKYNQGENELLLAKVVYTDDGEEEDHYLTVLNKHVSYWQGSADYDLKEVNTVEIKFHVDDIYMRSDRLCLYCKADNSTANFEFTPEKDSDFYSDLIDSMDETDQKKGVALRKAASREKKSSDN